MHTRKTDEELLIQFVEDQGFDQPELVEASERLKRCIKEGLQDYNNFAQEVVGNEDIHMAPIVGSSNTVSCGWKNETLAVEFKGGAIYHYFDVPVKVYGALMLAESFGKYLNKEIKPHYKCEKQ